MPPAPSEDQIVLENEIVRVTISRETGRVEAWTELATGLPLLSSPIGLSFRAGDADAPAPSPGGFLATVEENEALVYDPFGHGGFAVQILYRLLPGENAMEAEVALTNRTTNAIAIRSLRWTGRAAAFSSAAFVPVSPASGEGEAGGFSAVLNDVGGRTTLAFRVRFSAFGELPHDARFWSGDDSGRELLPESDPYVGAEAAFGLAEAATIRVARPLRGARLFLETEDGQTLEAPVDADPDRALVLPLGGVRPVGAMLRSAEGTDLAPRLGAPIIEVQTSWLPAQRWAESSDAQLATLEFDSAFRHLAAVERARRATEVGDDAAAEEALETALLYGGDDPFTWWAKAAAQRRVDSSRDRDEWLNARYLRPLEPLVAAEALLAQEPESPEIEAQNPLLRLVAGREAIAAGCVLAYAEAGAFQDAITLGGRILAVQNWRRVRLLMAGLYLARTRMVMEAAEHHASAQRAESEGEVEAGEFERLLLARVAERFGR